MLESLCLSNNQGFWWGSRLMDGTSGRSHTLQWQWWHIANTKLLSYCGSDKRSLPKDFQIPQHRFEESHPLLSCLAYGWNTRASRQFYRIFHQRTTIIFPLSQCSALLFKRKEREMYDSVGWSYDNSHVVRRVQFEMFPLAVSPDTINAKISAHALRMTPSHHIHYHPWMLDGAIVLIWAFNLTCIALFLIQDCPTFLTEGNHYQSTTAADSCCCSEVQKLSIPKRSSI